MDVWDCPCCVIAITVPALVDEASVIGLGQFELLLQIAVAGHYVILEFDWRSTGLQLW